MSRQKVRKYCSRNQSQAWDGQLLVKDIWPLPGNSVWPHVRESNSCVTKAGISEVSCFALVILMYVVGVSAQSLINTSNPNCQNSDSESNCEAAFWTHVARSWVGTDTGGTSDYARGAKPITVSLSSDHQVERSSYNFNEDLLYHWDYKLRERNMYQSSHVTLLLWPNPWIATWNKLAQEEVNMHQLQIILLIPND